MKHQMCSYGHMGARCFLHFAEGLLSWCLRAALKMTFIVQGFTRDYSIEYKS